MNRKNAHPVNAIETEDSISGASGKRSALDPRCSGVYATLDGSVVDMSNCYCGTCRKAHSAGLAAVVTARETDFRWTRGAEYAKTYPSSKGTRQTRRSRLRVFTRGHEAKDGRGLRDCRCAG